MKRFLLAVSFCALAAFAFGQDDPPTDPDGGDTGDTNVTREAGDPTGLNADLVRGVIERAASAVSSPLVIAVTDRQGNILAVYRKAGAPVTAKGNFGFTVDANELAVALARTASFFSNNQAPLSSRTVRTISGVHFPPGIMFTGVSDLYGIENTNRGCGFNTTFLPGVNLPPARSIDGTKPGLGVITGKPDLVDSDATSINPGGVPLFLNNKLVGGVGVVGPTFPIAEYAAFASAFSGGFGLVPPAPGVVIIGGIALPFVIQSKPPAGIGTGSPDGSYLVDPKDSPAPAPEGNLIQIQDGKFGLTAADVTTIINNAIATANSIRGVIRLPLGSRAKMVIAVADLDGTLLGVNRMPDATIFSADVAVAKARNVIYFTQHPDDKLPELSDNKGNIVPNTAGITNMPGVPAGTAVTNRTIGFGAQPFFPPGIDYSSAGPFFELFKYDVTHPCTQGADPQKNGNLNGIVFFPGAVPLYKNGVLVGGFGISGDGVDQDDFVTNGGSAGFEAPLDKRADRLMIRGVRLTYAKFPRDPQN